MALPGSASINDYGGIKQNDEPVEDYTTDEDANDRNRAFEDCAAMTHTATRCWRSFIGNATTPTDPVTSIHDANWGNSLGVKATVARVATGQYTVTFPTTVTDELGVVHTLVLRRAWVNAEGSTFTPCQATVTSSNVITVYTYNAAGAANDGVGITFTVFAV